jgi:hypothetical protein
MSGWQDDAVIVDRLEQRETGERVESSARLRWVGGEFRLRVTVPAGFEAPAGDASAWLACTLPLALYRHEDLYLDGEVSPLMLGGLEELQAVYASFDPAVRRCRVRVAAEAPAREPKAGVGGMFSRGVDSMFTATRERQPELTHLVFCDTMEPILDERVTAEELRLAGECASLLGLPLVWVSMNFRDPGAQIIEYQDYHGAGLATLGLSLSGGLGRAVLPPGGTYSLLVPAGSHPLLDPLFSTEALTVEHDSVAEPRAGKVRFLAEERPDLLPHLKVCQVENRSDNCGRCRKCMWTMICLQAAGALELAEGFPDEIDIEAIRELRLEHYLQRAFWNGAVAALGDSPRDRAVRDAVHRFPLGRSARPSPLVRARAAWDWLRGRRSTPDPTWSNALSGHLRGTSNAAMAFMRDGRPYPFGLEFASPQPKPVWSAGPLPPDWSPPPEPAADRIGLLRLIDRAAGRHRYAAGSLPPIAGAERVGELGALRAAGDVPVWLTDEGRLLTDHYEPAAARPRPAKALRWSLAPLRWRGDAPLPDLLRAALLRAPAVLASPNGAVPARGEPVGYLAAEAGGGRLPLWSAVHPVTGDQLLTTQEGDAGNLGYGEPVRLGYLEPDAPVSGNLGSGRPHIPWAARFGRRLS